MRILVNFMHRDGWNVHCLAEDCRTPISPYRKVSSAESLLKLLRYAGATDSDIDGIERSIQTWNRGSAFLNLAPARKNLLAIWAPWNSGLL